MISHSAEVVSSGNVVDSSTISADDPRRHGRPTWIEVDLDRLIENLRTTRKFIGERSRLMAVVKANAYGHGAPIVAETALASGADELAVATVDEAVSLRTFGIGAPVLVLGPIAPAEVPTAVTHGVSLTATEPAFAGLVAREVDRQHASPLDLHVKVDTGMNRFGASKPEAIETARYIFRSPGVRLAGVSTHFADADNDVSDFTELQVASLGNVVDALRAEGINPGLIHAANSAGILRGTAYHAGMVRLGIALYGLPTSTGRGLPLGYRPVLSVRSTVSRVINLAPGDTVSYGRTYTATEHERAGLVPVGYADGLRRDLSNQHVMAISGVRVPIRGRVCMDQSVVGLPVDSNVSVGSIVSVLGTGEVGELSFDAAAAQLGTIAYELVTALSTRLPRYYLRHGIPVAVTDLAGTRRL